MDTLQRLTTKELVGELCEMLPEPVDYADLVGAEGFAHGCCFVYEDPADYVIAEAAKRLESTGKTIAKLNAKLADAKDTLVSVKGYLDMVSEGVNDVATKRLRYALTRMRELAEACAEETAVCGYDANDIEPLPF